MVTCEYSRHGAFNKAGSTFSARSCRSLFVTFSSFLPMSLIELRRLGFRRRPRRVLGSALGMGVICPRVRAVVVLLILGRARRLRPWR